VNAPGRQRLHCCVRPLDRWQLRSGCGPWRPRPERTVSGT